MKNRNISIYLLTLTVLVIAGFILLSRENKKIGYVTTMKVFEEYALKKELEGEYKKIQIIRQSYLDSLKLNIQSLSVKSNTDVKDREQKIEECKKAYLFKENQFNQENENLYQQYNDQIWKQINQFVEDFGKENGFDYLLGASGQGNIMYAQQKCDVTKEVIEYLNNRYRGKKSK